MRRTFSCLNFIDSKNVYKAVERAKIAVSQKFSSSASNQELQKTNQDHHSFFQKKEYVDNQENKLASDTEGKKAFDDDIACSQ